MRIDREIYIVNDIRNCLLGLVKACVYGFCKPGKSNLLWRLLYISGGSNGTGEIDCFIKGNVT